MKKVSVLKEIAEAVEAVLKLCSMAVRCFLNSFLWIFFLQITLISCGSKYDLSESTLHLLRKEINKMYNKDQSIRKALAVNDSLFGVSPERGFIANKKEFLGNRYQAYITRRDSLIALMLEIDKKNTIRLIEMTSKYGFPSRERLNEKKAKAYFIFVHSAEEYHEKIRALLNVEYRNKRISEYEYAYIQWHLEGRRSMPPMMDKNGKVVY